MGANAVTSVYDYTAGQILTAEQVDNLNCGVPVFATTTTRDAAFGGTNEKVLAQGQMAFIEATNTTQFYNGSAWVSLNGLQFISATTIGNAVSSVTVSNAFSTTYDNYLIIVNGGVASADNVIAMTLGATATGYYHRSIYGTYSSTTNTVDNAQNATSWSIVGSGSVDNLDLLCQIRSPFAAKTTTFTAQTARSATNGLVISSGGYLANTTSYTAFTLTPNTGTLTGGTIYVYGYTKS